jgi:tRNA threonylcarbamoyladenosine biosynthesis protein TsaE
MSEVITQNEEETAAFAVRFAGGITGGEVVCLWGDLGAGKSVFCRSMIRTLSNTPDMEVPSPTFTLVQNYEVPLGMLWHFDLYRLIEPSEVFEIGWEEAQSGGIMLVEWPERLGALLPAHRIDVRLEAVPDQPNQRKITIICHGKKHL